jgi:type II secretory pathway pseudopilin PulG
LPSRQAGFTYLILLILVALLAFGLASVATVWDTLGRRERERELLFVGDQFRRAITSYQAETPTGARRFPTQLDDLLSDNRFPTVRRHLRRIYLDPMTGKPEWGLVKNGDAIIGVYSLSTSRPIKTDGFPAGLEHFKSAADYRGWTFAFVQPGTAPAAAGAAPPALSGMPVVGTTPVTSAPPPMEAPPPPPPLPDFSQRPKSDAQKCSAAYTEDQKTCAALDPERQLPCRLSAQARLTACRTEKPLPPLAS